ncbi:MAG: Hsp20/alpha crystallin family protein [Planctomycetota bacterium]|nr:MAG: Hsp20/alpha crystallin family protein [Planctomycetota bacterium]REJ96393.1 MAG: Hsp20/alpha crystallin family protein [Planctomycetota bacterium]REK29664.1 MAG: Hsp20/alpha crystallin family protein [Planctomycetota bacterium]REK30516.1 MAG: Hsp20/alpha crystallin family protein [Planctomycetota bacterium]
MAVFRWGSSIDAFRDLEREMDRWLRSVNFSMDGVRIGRQYPPVNIYELEDEFLLTAEVPGTKADDVEISIADGMVTIRGDRSDAATIPEDRFRRCERPRGAWERVLALPERIREDDLHAELTHGVLTLHLPKSPPSQARQIPIVDSEPPAGSNEAPGQ